MQEERLRVETAKHRDFVCDNFCALRWFSFSWSPESYRCIYWVYPPNERSEWSRGAFTAKTASYSCWLSVCVVIICVVETDLHIQKKSTSLFYVYVSLEDHFALCGQGGWRVGWRERRGWPRSRTSYVRFTAHNNSCFFTDRHHRCQPHANDLKLDSDIETLENDRTGRCHTVSIGVFTRRSMQNFLQVWVGKVEDCVVISWPGDGFWATKNVRVDKKCVHWADKRT